MPCCWRGIFNGSAQHWCWGIWLQNEQISQPKPIQTLLLRFNLLRQPESSCDLSAVRGILKVLLNWLPLIFVSFSRDEVTFLPSLFYLKGWLAQVDSGLSSPHQVLQFAAELGNFPSSELLISAEQRYIVKTLQIRARSLLSLHLPSIGRYMELESLQVLGCEAHSVYEGLTNPENGPRDVNAEICKLLILFFWRQEINKKSEDLKQLCHLLCENIK